MVEPPPLVNNDRQHLRLLSIFHYIAAGLSVFGLLFLVGYTVLMAQIFSEVPTKPEEREVLALVQGMMLSFGGFFAIFAVAKMVALVFAARFLTQYRNHTFCLVVAAVSCLSIPLGTVLGVFTIVVLLRPSVKALFDGAGSPG